MNNKKRIERMNMKEVNTIYNDFLKDLANAFAKVQCKINQAGARTIRFKYPVFFAPYGTSSYEAYGAKEIRISEIGEIEVVWLDEDDVLPTNLDEFTLEGTVDFFSNLLFHFECRREEKGEEILPHERFARDEANED